LKIGRFGRFCDERIHWIEGLENRYRKLAFSIRIPGTEFVIKKLNHIFSKVETFKSGGFDEQEFEVYEVYIDALDADIKELKEHLQEIDKEFE
jgi:hypothetical protein